MTKSKRLLCVFAHPDDETLGAGSTLAKYAAAGVELYLVTATRGERGWQADPSADPGPQALSEIRTAELLAAAQVLGIRDIQFLNYLDGDLDQADPAEAIGRIVSHIRRHPATGCDYLWAGRIRTATPTTSRSRSSLALRSCVRRMRRMPIRRRCRRTGSPSSIT